MKNEQDVSHYWLIANTTIDIIIRTNFSAAGISHTEDDYDKNEMDYFSFTKNK